MLPNAEVRPGAASALNLTSCIKKYKEGTPTISKCPNCGEGHHAWNTACPERLKRLVYPSSESIVEQRTPRVFTHKLHTWMKTANPATVDSSMTNSTTNTGPSIPVRPNFPEVKPHHTNKCTSCGNPNNSTQDFEFLTTILQIALSPVGRKTDRSQIKEVVSNLLVSERPGTSVPPSQPTEETHAPPPVNTSLTSSPTQDTSLHTTQQTTTHVLQNQGRYPVRITTTESASSNGTSQRKRFRRSPTSDNQENETLSDQDYQSSTNQNVASQQPPIEDEFDLHFPPLGTVSYSTTTEGSLPVLHIPENNPGTAHEYLLHVDSDNTSDFIDN